MSYGIILLGNSGNFVVVPINTTALITLSDDWSHLDHRTTLIITAYIRYANFQNF